MFGVTCDGKNKVKTTAGADDSPLWTMTGWS